MYSKSWGAPLKIPQNGTLQTPENPLALAEQLSEQSGPCDHKLHGSIQLPIMDKDADDPKDLSRERGEANGSIATTVLERMTPHPEPEARWPEAGSGGAFRGWGLLCPPLPRSPAFSAHM